MAIVLLSGVSSKVTLVFVCSGFFPWSIDLLYIGNERKEDTSICDLHPQQHIPNFLSINNYTPQQCNTRRYFGQGYPSLLDIDHFDVAT